MGMQRRGDWWHIDWSYDAEHIELSQSEYNERFQWYRKNGYLIDNRKGSGYRTDRIAWIAHPWSYCVDQDGRQVNLYATDDDGHFRIYYTYFEPSKHNRDLGVSGGAAFRLVDSIFKERNGKTLQAAFGRCEENFIFSKVNDALAPIIYTNESDCDYILRNIYKADRSSAYPFELRDPLPDLHKKSIKQISGVYPPTEEYPFAFYVNSGHMAIYEELDTYNDFRTHPLYSVRGKWNDSMYGSKEITILMKASRYHLSDIMQELYDMKNTNANIKTMMVAFIGYIRSTKSWQKHYMGHLSAVVYARHIKEMLRLYDEIKKERNVIEMIATDSICWRGHAMPGITSKEKYFGAFVSEYEDAKLLMLANGVYGIEVNGELSVFKHQGTSADKIVTPIQKLADIKKLKYMPIPAFDSSTNQFVEIDPILHRKRPI